MAGTLCEPLCTSKEIHYSQCFPGGWDKVFVAGARWKKKEVVLKSVKAPKLLSNLLEHTTLTAEEFKRKVIIFLQCIVAVYTYMYNVRAINLSACTGGLVMYRYVL